MVSRVSCRDVLDVMVTVVAAIGIEPMTFRL